MSQTSPSLSSLGRKLLACFSLEWLTVLPDLYRLLHQWWHSYRHEGTYEVLSYRATLELLDAKGKTSIFKKQQRIKLLQANIIAFEDYAWGDGDIFVDYKCSPGVPVDRYQEGDRWNVLISLRETKNPGEITNFYIERTVKNGFTTAEEAWQVEMRNRTRYLKLEIIFPKERRCKRALLVPRNHHSSTRLGPDHFSELPDGRQVLTWETDKIKRFEIYTLRWSW